jgi:hypothetical protein
MSFHNPREIKKILKINKISAEYDYQFVATQPL